MSKRKCPKNLVFISGMHGCGKDTLIEDFLEMSKETELPFKLIRYNKCEMTSFEDIFERQVRRIAKYVIDYHRAEKIANENPDSIVITDRCYWDGYCYLKALYKLNWIDEEDCEYLFDLLVTSFKLIDVDSIKPVLLLPPYEFVKNNLYIRQQIKGSKWRENDDKYCRVVCKMYNELYMKHKNILETITLTNRDDRVNVLKFILKDRIRLMEKLFV